MKIETFALERTQSLWEHTVEYNLTETGIHPLTLTEFLNQDEIEGLHSLRLGYGQTNGSIELRDAISAMYPGTNRNNVLVTNGSIEANFVAIWSLLDEGDELILMLPNYMQIWGLARAFGIHVRPFYLKEELDWQPDVDELAGLITPKTRMIAICDPNNPTGAILSQTSLSAIVRIAREANVWLYADQVYSGAELSGRPSVSSYGLYNKVIVAGGLSKAYALPGLRIGWLVGPEPELAEAWSRRDYTTIATSILSNYIAALALAPGRREQILFRNRNILNDNLGVLTEWANNCEGLFDFIPPKAGGMAFLKYNFDVNSTELVTRIREEQSTFIVAGDCFGMDHWVRIGIGSERDYLVEGLRRVSEVLTRIT